MGIRIEKSFVVDATKDEVWRFLTDPARVAGALPGASITEKIDDHNYKGKMSMKVGPVSASYRGKVTFERLDEAAGEADIKAVAQDVGGRGGADMKMSSKIEEQESGGTEVSVVSEVNVMGLLAQLGRGMIQDVSDVLFEQFTKAMQADIAKARSGGAPPAEEPGGGDEGGESAESTEEEPPAAATATETEPPAREVPQASAQAPAESPAPQASTAPDAPPAPQAPAPQAAAPAAPPAKPEVPEEQFDAVDFGAKVARRALARRLTSPIFWLVVVAIVVLIWLVLR